MAGRLAAYSCRGSRSFELRSLLIPFRGTCRNCALIATGRVLQVRMLARIAALLYPQRRNGCPKGLNREVRGPSGQSRHCSRNCNRIAHRHDAIGNANSREGGEKARRSGSQETGPIPSFLRAGGMNRADEGQSRGGAAPWWTTRVRSRPRECR